MTVNYEESGDRLRFETDGISTDWIGKDDSFIRRIDKANLNPAFSHRHLVKEIRIRNRLDEGTAFLKAQRYAKSIACFDDVIFYDGNYALALIYKSRALMGQGHFIKALRHYKRAVNADGSLKDVDYQKELMKAANDERGNFPKIKLNIYNGDEHFARGEFEKAVESYDRALNDPSGFKEKILFRLLNKKGTALFNLNELEKAMECFSESVKIDGNDYATYFLNLCRFQLEGGIGDEFKRHLKIGKAQTLCQVRILNELELFRESLAICDDYVEEFFIVDDTYLGIIDCKAHAMDCLGLDSEDLEVLNEVFGLSQCLSDG